MKLIKSLMGRRQFLVAAGVTSTLGLGLKKLLGIYSPTFETKFARASDSPAGGVNPQTNGTESAENFSSRYSHLLSPLKIGNVVLKNRMMHTQSLPFYLQGPEIFPSEQVISHYAGIARNGAAIVTCKNDSAPTDRRKLQGISAHLAMWDLEDPGVQNYFAQLIDAVHFYDAKASIALRSPREAVPQGYSISDGASAFPMGRGGGTAKEIPVELIRKLIDDIASESKLYQSIGFDMVSIHMSYGAGLLASSLSPVRNQRKDQYGGSIENRGRLALELFQAIKKACGTDFLIDAYISGEEEGGGYTLEDAVQFAKLWEGSLDILQLRAKSMNGSHPTGFNQERHQPVALTYAQAVKESGAKIVTAPVGGFQDPDLNEAAIASGKTDMIGMARAFLSDPEYGKKIYEGRGEDVIPCILCNRCHGGLSGTEGPWFSYCTVNPKLGIAHRLNRMIDAPGVSRKVAVIGGGPAGMKAAVTAAERGHRVTLYEKNDFLGGQIRYTDFVSFKWPLKDFKDYLIRQTEKAGVNIHLSTKVTPETIKAKGYDAVLVAIGADPLIPEIPGADGRNVLAPIYVYGNNTLGKDIVVIGGDQIGTETGIYLAQKGHRVTVLTEDDRLADDANQIVQIRILREAYESLKNFSAITNAAPTRISEGSVSYTDDKVNEQTIKADNVVISSGRKPRNEEALAFYGTAPRFFLIGDCRSEGNVQKSIRTAFAAASQI